MDALHFIEDLFERSIDIIQDWQVNQWSIAESQMNRILKVWHRDAFQCMVQKYKKAEYNKEVCSVWC